MKCSYLALLLLLVPFMVHAQKNETIKPDKKAKKMDDQQVFIFPDSIKFYKKELNERVEKKTILLTEYLKKIAVDKDDQLKNDISAAMKLFNNDERRMVTVTSKRNPEPVTKPVRKYLNDLAQLHYNKVSITWHNAQYVSKFTKQPDGTYAAIVAFEQEFTGIKSGEINYTYHDLTQKRAEVIVRVWDHKDNGVITKAYMEVFLGNIGVTEE